MDRPKYRIEIFWSDEDDGYIANVPALRYCSAFGEFYEEALREVLVAMELHLHTMQELDRPVPEMSEERTTGAVFQIYMNALGEYGWRLLSSDGEVVTSSEGYRSKDESERAIRALKEQGSRAEIVAPASS